MGSQQIDCLKFTKTKKDEDRFMLFQITQICSNESDYVTLDSAMNIMTETAPK